MSYNDIKKIKVLISGGNGRFAKEFIKVASEYDILAPPKDVMDVRDISSIQKIIDKFQPDIFLHAGGFVRPMSKHNDNPEESIMCNIIGTSNVTISCIKNNIKLVYLSTDYVYPGNEGNYHEESPLLPINKYAWSKLGGECSVQLYDNSLILRLSMTPRPFEHAMALDDCYKSAIYIDEAANIVLSLLDQKGIINVGGRPRSVYEFAKETNPGIGRISLEQIKDVEMAKNSTMNIKKMKRIIHEKQ